MNRFPSARLTGAGFLATLVLYLMGAGSALLSHREMDLASALGGVFSRDARPEIGSGAWVLGLVLLAVLAVVIFPVCFTQVFGRKPEPVLYSHRQKPYVRALIWSGLLWAFFEAVVKPASGSGFFSMHMSHPVTVSFLTLLCWTAYSFVFVYMLRARAAEPPAMRQHAA